MWPGEKENLKYAAKCIEIVVESLERRINNVRREDKKSYKALLQAHHYVKEALGDE